MRIITTLCLTLCGLFALEAQPTPFYQEIFPSASAFTTNWTQGGVNPGSERWVWSNNPVGIFQGQPNFASTTAANGFIQFNSDRNGDVRHDVFVTSRPIDCRGRSRVFLRSENQYAYFSPGGVSIAEVGVSTDGTNFVYKTIFANVARDVINVPVQVVVVELPEAANQPSVSIRFRWRGQFEYVWRIDDVALFDSNPTPSNDLVVSEPRIPFNFATPISQVDSIAFALRLENEGTAPQTNVVARVEVIGDNGDRFTGTENLGTIAPGEADTIAFRQQFLPTRRGNYTFKYTVTQAQTDATPGNNTVEGEFVISESIFSKDDGVLVSANQPSTVRGDFWEVGNYYTIVKDGFEAYEASFSVASQRNSQVGQTVTVILYRLEDNGNTVFNDEDLKVVGIGFKELGRADTSFQLITTELFPLDNDDRPGVALTPGDYFLMVQLTKDMFMPYSEIGYYYDFATVVKNGDWFLGGFGPEVTAIARMRIRARTTGADERQLADQQVKIYPNPAQQTLNVKMELQAPSRQTQLKVTDAAGSVIALRQYEGIQAQTLTLDTSRWPSGVYFLQVLTEEGVATRRFAVQR